MSSKINAYLSCADLSVNPIRHVPARLFLHPLPSEVAIQPRRVHVHLLVLASHDEDGILPSEGYVAIALIYESEGLRHLESFQF